MILFRWEYLKHCKIIDFSRSQMLIQENDHDKKLFECRLISNTNLNLILSSMAAYTTTIRKPFSQIKKNTIHISKIVIKKYSMTVIEIYF